MGVPVPVLAQADVEANTTTRAELESLPGLGPALAQRLQAARALKNWVDRMHRVPGNKAATARRLRAQPCARRASRPGRRTRRSPQPLGANPAEPSTAVSEPG